VRTGQGRPQRKPSSHSMAFKVLLEACHSCLLLSWCQDMHWVLIGPERRNQAYISWQAGLRRGHVIHTYHLASPVRVQASGSGQEKTEIACPKVPGPAPALTLLGLPPQICSPKGSIPTGKAFLVGDAAPHPQYQLQSAVHTAVWLPCFLSPTLSYAVWEFSPFSSVLFM
jgi:hypothetical protein